MQTKLFQSMTADERLQWATQFGEYLKTEWPLLQPATVPDRSRSGNPQSWTPALQQSMTRLITLLLAWPFARDFCEKANRYGDYAARAYRMPVYIEKVLQMLEQQGDARTIAAAAPAASPSGSKRKPGRPASPATIAKREAEAKAAQQQTALFNEATTPVHSPDVLGGASFLSSVPVAGVSSVAGADSAVPSPTASVPDGSPAGQDYRLSIAQKRMLLSPDLASRADSIRTLRGAMAAAAERAKILADLNRPQSEIEAAAKESIEANDAYQSILADIDTELATIYYRLQNDSDEWRKQWLQKHGFIKPNAAVPSGSPAGKKATTPVASPTGLLPDDLKHDLRRHYEKVKSPDFDLRCRTLIEQESPEYVAKQKAEAEKKKEVQDILRYLKRKDKGKSLETSRAKFARLQELLGKKEAANYRPLLTKIEDDAKSASSGSTAGKQKATVPSGSTAGMPSTTPAASASGSVPIGSPAGMPSTTPAASASGNKTK